MENWEYSAGFMAQAVWFIEFKKVVQLISAGKTREEIRRACVEENLFGAPNPYRSGRMFGYLTNRAAAMDAELLELFLHSDMNTQKIINLICILNTDRLFYEFVYEVYREKAYLGIDTLSLGDISAYFHNKAARLRRWAAGMNPPSGGCEPAIPGHCAKRGWLQPRTRKISGSPHHCWTFP